MESADHIKWQPSDHIKLHFQNSERGCHASAAPTTAEPPTAADQGLSRPPLPINGPYKVASADHIKWHFEKTKSEHWISADHIKWHRGRRGPYKVAFLKIAQESDRISADHITILKLHFQRKLDGFSPSMPLSTI